MSAESLSTPVDPALLRRWRAQWSALTDDQAGRLVHLTRELERWNRKINLTARAPFSRLLERVVDDSLLLVPLVTGRSMIDVGSGPGLPALPLAICHPQVEVRSVEPIAKKVAFTRAFAGLYPDLLLRPFVGRSEPTDVTPPWGDADTVVSRAFTQPDAWIPIGAPRVRPGGRLLVTLGSSDGSEGDAVAAAHGLEFEALHTGGYGGVQRAVRVYRRPAGESA